MKGTLLIGEQSTITNFTNLLNSYSSAIEMNLVEIGHVSTNGIIVKLIGSSLVMDRTQVTDISGSESS